MENIYDNETFFDAYAQMSRSRDGLAGAGEWRQFRDLFPDMSGMRVLDLGCGYGWHCKYAAERGAASVLGIDLSEKMIARAREINGDERITYRICGLEEYEYPEEEYDCVVSNLALHYIEDLDTVYQKICRTLKPGGIFLLNIEHPVFTAGVNEDWIYDKDGNPEYWPVDDYYYPGERSTLFLGERVRKYHHTLTQILMGLRNAGFALEAVEEAMPDESMLDIPGMKDEMRRPMMLLVRARK
ncbi:MAG TPA: class I SAM-dependent methyltransferase [Candidatus Mediterraneibacter stercoripullorum]|nr:class I SAM-dependent methyltransferase [Candidatus Mediterraneibacter stercoripullorum]